MMWFLLSGSLEFWYMLGRGCLCDQPPIKTLDSRSLPSFPGWQHSPRAVTPGCWGVKGILCDSTKRMLGRLYLVSPKISTLQLPSPQPAVTNYSPAFSCVFDPARTWGLLTHRYMPFYCIRPHQAWHSTP